jgi:hypothetical protein
MQSVEKHSLSALLQLFGAALKCYRGVGFGEVGYAVDWAILEGDSPPWREARNQGSSESIEPLKFSFI